MRFSQLLGLVIAVLWVTSEVSAQGLDQTCTASVNGQAVKVNPDGTFQVSNISAGPELVRVEVVCQKNGQTFYGQSEFFEVKQNQTFSIGDVALSPTPPVKVASLTATTSPTTLTQPGQSAQVSVIAIMTNGLTQDVTGPPELTGTTYTSSNASVATINSLGVVTAKGTGVAFVTARSQGAAAVAQVNVSFADPGTTVSGLVTLQTGDTVGGASVKIVGQGLSSITESDGSFSIKGALAQLGPIIVSANAIVDGEPLFGSSAPVAATLGGITDVGLLTLGVFQDKVLTSPADFSGAETLVDAESIPLQLVSTQFAGVGLIFQMSGGGPIGMIGDSLPRQFGPPGNNAFDNYPSGSGPCSGNPLLSFSTERNRIAFEVRTNNADDVLLTLRVVRNGQVIGTHVFSTNSAFAFVGLESSVPFDQVVVDVFGTDNGCCNFDNVRFE